MAGPGLSPFAQFASDVRHALNLPTLLAIDLAAAVLGRLCRGATVLFYADRYPTLNPEVITERRPPRGDQLA